MKLCDYTGRPLDSCTDLETFNALIRLVKDAAARRGYQTGKKKLYYLSAEFLIGKLLSNNLINLGVYDEVKEELAAAGKSLAALEEIEAEPSLGNGGLGRLAACFLDSAATLGLYGDGVGLNYHLGLFRQKLADNFQRETPDAWLSAGHQNWLRPTNVHYDVEIAGRTFRSTLYDLDVTGYHNACGRLRLFDLDTVDESIVHDGIQFDKTDLTRNLTLFLYPDDSDEAGRLLRIAQQYFLVSNAARLLLDECVSRGSNLHDLPDYAAVQINDTHPTMVIPELIRLLTARGIGEDEAVDLVTRMCGYTNHTILAEALETWPVSYLERMVPQLMPVIRRLDARVRAKTNDPAVQILDSAGRVHMAHIDLHFTHSTNGVAELHTEILKKTELAPFYRLYPERFNNKTNGVTFRRWLMECNPRLTALLDESIGTSWRQDADKLTDLLRFRDDKDFLRLLDTVKYANKAELARWLRQTQGVNLCPDTVFDMQVKRLHEYKRQQLNALWLIHTYLNIRSGRLPPTPVTVIFGAKAAPAYTIAKDIIHLILCLAQVINSDPAAQPYLRVAMVENYNVTAAEKLIPACDLSEQISLASREASGTGNMKFMLNGAVTLGTLDGANVEIARLVGGENIYVFGSRSDEVIARYQAGSYHPREYCDRDPTLKAALDFLVSDEMLSVGNEESLRRLYGELMDRDWFMTMPDFADYCRVKENALRDAADRPLWARKALENIARAGYFSADRTVRQYNEDIWHL